MKLDRNENDNGKGKYALLQLRKLPEIGAPGFARCMEAIKVLEAQGIVEWGYPETHGEFFVIKLRDAFAEAPLIQYANGAMLGGEKEYAQEVINLANRAGKKSPFCKRPD